jgi:hypothetical protein
VAKRRVFILSLLFFDGISIKRTFFLKNIEKGVARLLILPIMRTTPNGRAAKQEPNRFGGQKA